ncbi:MAG: hypothetical protein LAN62_08860 [Acidobacteriia bacterium]|nr:hypothetical protein [Terriglobia bacterium]
MAAISQKISPEEIVPLLAQHVAMHGFTGTGSHRAPTEYLILLQAYVRQAKELRTLAGAEGVIHIASCGEAQPLLAAIGYRLAQPCGPGASLEGADPRRAFLTLDSGFPLTDLEQTLRSGKPFAYPFPSSQVPALFSPSEWTAKARNKSEDLLEVILHDPNLARLYWALAQLDEPTRTALWRSPGLGGLLPVAPVLDFYGSQIAIRSGRVVVPGGAGAESVWKDLVGASPDSPGEFVARLLAKDAGWLAAYFDALSRVNSTQQAYFTEPRRLRRNYEALRGRSPDPGATRPVFRPDPGLLLLVTRLSFDPTGQPHLPGNLQVWKQFLGKKGNSKLITEWARRARHWESPDQVVEGLFGLSRVTTVKGPLDVFLTLSELDRERPPEQRLSPQTVRLLAEKYPQFHSQYPIFAEFRTLNSDSITRFLNVAEDVNRVSDPQVRADALGLLQANLGLWQILARQGQIPLADWNPSWQRVIYPFANVHSSAQLFDVARSSLGEVLRAATGRLQLSQDEIIALLAGPKQVTPVGQQVELELANKTRSVLSAQRLVPLDTLLALGDGLNQVAQGKTTTAALLALAGDFQEFEMPKPLFTTGERVEWAYGLYNKPHTQAETQTNLAGILKSSSSPGEFAAARGQLVPFLRDTLVGLNYAYYAPPGAHMIYHNALFVRSHDFGGEITTGGDHAWESPRLYGRGSAAGGGAHLVGSLADLPYVLAQVEQNFIVPQNVQALIWEDLVPSLLTSAILPRWWQVTRNELHAVTLHQRYGEELLAAAGQNAELRERAINILSDRMLPERSEQVEEALRGGRPEAALSLVTPAETFYLAAEFRRRFPREGHPWGKAGQELDSLAQQHPQEVRWERLSEDFGVPHPALADTYNRELLTVKPFPTFMGYSSRLLAESWDSNNLYWARLADESGFPPEMLNVLVPQLTHRMVEKISATHLADWLALLRALRETGDDFRRGKVASLPSQSTAPSR